MNYLKLITQFWKLRRSKRITNMQADLYFYLIQECNDRGWENPFECSNKLIVASIPITEPSLIDARNRLKQLGLIDFVGGKKNERSPVYTIVYLNDLSRNRAEGLVNPLVESEENTEHIKDKTKRKLNVNKLTTPADAGAPKNFKQWTTEDFVADIQLNKADHPKDLLNGFYKYWVEKSPTGKMRFQLEKTWETNLRLANWAAKPYNQSFKNGSNQKHSPNGGNAKPGRSQINDTARANY